MDRIDNRIFWHLERFYRYQLSVKIIGCRSFDYNAFIGHTLVASVAELVYSW